MKLHPTAPLSEQSICRRYATLFRGICAPFISESSLMRSETYSEESKTYYDGQGMTVRGAEGERF